jgi:hypothetical protein
VNYQHSKQVFDVLWSNRSPPAGPPIAPP